MNNTTTNSTCYQEIPIEISTEINELKKLKKKLKIWN